jgi:hypothetical protein
VSEFKPESGTDFLHPCGLHADELKIEGDMEPACPNCGMILTTQSCIWCGASWIVFGTGYDDVVADALVDEYGDLYCARCYDWYHEDQEEEEDQEECWNDEDDEDWP